MTNPARSSLFVWRDEACDSTVVTALASQLECPDWFASILVRRGVTDKESADRWLNPRLKHIGDPLAMPDSEAAARRILQAIDQKERITLFGDYDVDGLTSVALLFDLLSAIGVEVSPFLPLRLEEGYGLSLEAFQRCVEETRPTLLITVDCGTNSVESVQRARELGIDVIITDHHEVGDVIAPAHAVMNPRRSPDAALHVLAGVGVAFKLAHAVLKIARQQGRTEAWVQTDPREFLDLVALGTVADLVPLLHENRIFVHHGLHHLNHTKRVGLRALIDVAKITKDIDTYEVGFLLGPRLNASGRLGNARMSLQLLLSRSPAEAGPLATQLDEANRERQQVERTIVEELKGRISSTDRLTHLHSIVEAEADWHPGVVGIVASRLVQQFHRPTVVIGMDDLGRAKGSCRSIPGLNMVEVLEECHAMLTKHGGHAMAAGLEIEWDKIPAFRQKFDEACRSRLTGVDLAPHLRIDGWIDFHAINMKTIEWLTKLKPFGMGHPEPVWGSRSLQAATSPREVGQGHLKVRLSGQGNECEAIGFGLYNRPLPPKLDGAFQLRLDTFRGRSEVTLHLKDFRTSL